MVSVRPTKSSRLIVAVMRRLSMFKTIFIAVVLSVAIMPFVFLIVWDIWGLGISINLFIHTLVVSPLLTVGYAFLGYSPVVDQMMYCPYLLSSVMSEVSRPSILTSKGVIDSAARRLVASLCIPATLVDGIQMFTVDIACFLISQGNFYQLGGLVCTRTVYAPTRCP